MGRQEVFFFLSFIPMRHKECNFLIIQTTNCALGHKVLFTGVPQNIMIDLWNAAADEAACHPSAFGASHTQKLLDELSCRKTNLVGAKTSLKDNVHLPNVCTHHKKAKDCKCRLKLLQEWPFWSKTAREIWSSDLRATWPFSLEILTFV